ncbi:hypothetical protein L506_2304 [Bordetella bronchiseptica GA96-01]|uniref:hypothetical protein n=1 Tax=Bordetella bronchiseptica TaxID=518 RepID=UPI00045A1FFA|nr:hypothetical protein [Bordetella bronchiseptica]AZW31521.1 hypothetical protein CS343_15250 [Bordetella bronchiseptica]KCV40773.1 hypothetical protein L572_2331 [Bordetella bronchiseptica 345]KDC42129.1 hypothetical protein L506_2304 [Bordetella bronchiseptica GA96-01]
MKPILSILATTTAIVAVTFFAAAVFVLGQKVAESDVRLFKADDERRTRMIARACGTHGQLWQEPQTGRYACVYVNPDGALLMQHVSDSPLLTVRR